VKVPVKVKKSERQGFQRRGAEGEEDAEQKKRRLNTKAPRHKGQIGLR